MQVKALKEIFTVFFRVTFPVKDKHDFELQSLLAEQERQQAAMIFPSLSSGTNKAQSSLNPLSTDSLSPQLHEQTRPV